MLISPNPAPSPTPTPTFNFQHYLQQTRSIEGWFFPQAAAIWDSLLSFQNQQGIRGHQLEIGVHHGLSATLMAMRGQPGESCVLVDLLMKEGIVRQSIQQVGHPEGVEVGYLRQDSRDLLAGPLMMDGRSKFRFMHIDGEHTGEAIANDLDVASLLVAPDGIVAIDDFFSPLYPQITESVFRYLSKHPYQFTLFLCGFGKAYLARPKFAHRYLKFCRESLVDEIEQRGMLTTVSRTTMPTEMVTYGILGRMGNKRHRGPDWSQHVLPE